MKSIKNRIGIILGSFNPIHNGHLAMAQTCLASTYCDMILFVPAKQNPFKEKYSISDQDRLKMISMAIDSNNNVNFSDNIFLDDSEFNNSDCLSGCSYDTLEFIKNGLKNTQILGNEIFIEDEIILIVGTDIYLEIPKWYRGQEILDNYKFIVFKRENDTLPEDNKNILVKFTLSEPLCSLSSSEIRYKINHNILKTEEANLYLPFLVYKYIKENNLYVNITET